MSEPASKTQQFFHALNKDTMHLVDEFYDADVYFRDPLVEHRGRAQIREYYSKLYKNVESIRFEFLDEVKQGQTHAVTWVMTVIAKGFNGGKPVAVDGISYVRFGGREGKAVYHRDYFDMGQFVYEHIPVLGGMIRTVNKVMSQQK